MVNKCLFFGINKICVLNPYIKASGSDEFDVCINSEKCNKYEEY